MTEPQVRTRARTVSISGYLVPQDSGTRPELEVEAMWGTVEVKDGCLSYEPAELGYGRTRDFFPLTSLESFSISPPGGMKDEK